MKAISFDQYGGPEVLEIVELEKPSPKPNEVLVKIHASSVNSADWRMRTLSMPKGMGLFARPAFGFSGPRNKVLGLEFSGTIEAVGSEVSRFSAGDSVFCMTGGKLGAHAEYKCIPEESTISLKPENLSFEQAAALSFGGTTALHFLLDKGKIQKGERVLINGASGTVGSAAVQLAKYFGAEVTAVCSEKNHAKMKELGADYLIDYRKDDFAKNSKTYDIILDAVGTAPWNRSNKSLKPNGRLLVILGNLGEMLQALWVKKPDGKQIGMGAAPETQKDLNTLADIASSGGFTPLIDSVHPFEEFQKAHAIVDTGHKVGAVVLKIGNS